MVVDPKIKFEYKSIFVSFLPSLIFLQLPTGKSQQVKGVRRKTVTDIKTQTIPTESNNSPTITTTTNEMKSSYAPYIIIILS